MMDPANPFAAFSLIVAPAILTNASSVLAMSTGNRLARSVDRARDLARQLEAKEGSHETMTADSRAEFERRLKELSATEVRTTMLLHVLQSFYFALGGFASSTLAALLGAVLAPIGPNAAVIVLELRRWPPGRSASRRSCAGRSSWCARRALRCASSASGRQAFARSPATIIGMIFGPASSDLLPGAHNAVETCLAIQPGERVALIADRASREVAASLERALTECRAVATCLSIEAWPHGRWRLRRRRCWPRSSRPTPASSAYSRRRASCGARAIVGVVERRRIRYAHMVGVTPRIMCEGMRADYHHVDRPQPAAVRAHAVGAAFDGADGGGHQLHGDVRPALAWVKTSGIINPRYWSNLPAGEVFTTPASVDGTFVCDGTAGDYFNAKYGTLDSSPLVLEIRGGRLKSATCDRADLQRRFLGLLSYRREQRPRRRAGVWHEPRPARDDRDPAAGRESARRAHRVRRSVRQPDARRLVVTDARRRADARVRRLDRRRAGDRARAVPAREVRSGDGLSR